jgi:hypothetical protein
VEALRLNLGCGSRRLDGFLNVDRAAACKPDALVDLERLPWPWADGAVSEVTMSHVLEHLGRDPELFLGIMKELYRVCRHGARITIVVPHPRHDHFLDDPTHVRCVTADGLRLFSQRLNRDWAAQGVGNTPLGIYLGVDFEVEEARYDLDEPWRGQLARGEISQQDVATAESRYNNVVSQIWITLRVEKA